VTRYWFVHDHRAEFPVNKLCELVELPRATYCRWAKPVLSDRYLDKAYLSNTILAQQLLRCARRHYWISARSDYELHPR